MAKSRSQSKRRAEASTEPAIIQHEPRWPAAIAILGVGGVYLSLPPHLTVGPSWALLVIVAALLVPTIVSHKIGYHRVNLVLGHLSSIVVTGALIASLVALLTGLPGKLESPSELLRSAAALWATNILVFALWYWRLDAGGPHARDARGHHCEGAFLFPQMMSGLGIPQDPDWTPRFVDYLFVAFNTSTAFSPTDTPVLSRWAKLLTMLQSVISLLIVAVLVSHAIGVL